MKRYSFNIRKLRDNDNKIVKFQEDLDVLITSEEFIKNFRGYIEDIARFKRVKGRKYLRSTDYAAIGIMDINDMYQEAYLAFFEAYDKYKKSANDFEDGGAIWSYLKKTTILNFERQIRGKKDGVRVPERALFENSVNTNLLTTLFSQLEKVFFRNQEDVALTKYETDLVGMFLEVHMDEHLDLTRKGNRDLKKNERDVIKSLYGIDRPRMTYAEVSEYYKVGQSTIRSVKERAVKRLQTEESKREIANFLHEYRINTQADTEKYRN